MLAQRNIVRSRVETPPQIIFSKHLKGPDRNLCDKLSEKHICLVVGDTDFEKTSFQIGSAVKSLAKPSTTITASWRSFLACLPFLKADMIVVFSIGSLESDFREFKRNLERFKDNNPESVVMVWNPSENIRTRNKLNRLQQEELISHVEHRIPQFPVLLQRGADMLHGL